MTRDDPHRPPFDQSLIGAVHRPWTRLEVLAEAASTNAVLAERARRGESDGVVLVADHQTAGRGRLDRRWETPPRAALTFSVLVHPADVAPDRWPWLPLLTGVAVAEAVPAVLGTGCDLKWPNDVLVSGRKLGGLLVERVETARGPAAVLGVGLNVSTTPEELPVPTATSLLVEGATLGEHPRERLLAEVLARLGDRYRRWLGADAADQAELRSAYRRLCSTLGRPVEVHLPGGGVRPGTAEDVEADGALRVRTAQGPLVVHSGDVVHVRAGGPPA